ncbi:MAG: SPOR domain-containing protein [Pseudomonadota bacterium]
MIYRLMAFLCFSAFCAQAAAQLLSVDQSSGGVEVERGGKTLRLSLNDPLIESDVVRIDSTGRLSVRFADRGLFELGPGAEAIIERLPYASFAPELSTVIRLKHGFLRAVWNPPATPATWSLRVKLGGLRASLAAGEYFFEAATPTLISSTACVANGVIELVEEMRGALTLKPSRCYHFESNGPKIAEYSESDWVALRNDAVLRPPQPAPPPAAIVRKPQYEIENAPPAQLQLQADTAPLEKPTPAALTGEKKSDLSGALARTEAKPRPLMTPIVVTPASNPLPQSAHKQTGHWTLQLTASASLTGAEREAKKLKAAGYEPEIMTAEVNGKTWHRVRITGYADAIEARKAGDEIKTRLGYPNIWIAKAK